MTATLITPGERTTEAMHADPFREPFVHALAQYGHPTADLLQGGFSPVALARRSGLPESHITGALQLISFPVAEGAAPEPDSGLYIGTFGGENVWAADDPFDPDAERYAQGLLAFRPQAPGTPPPAPTQAAEAPSPVREQARLRTIMDALHVLGFGDIQPAELGEANYQERLLQQGRVTHEQLAQAYARFTGKPYIDPRRDPPHPDVRNLLSLATINSFKIVPHAKHGNTLTVLMVDPTDAFSLTAVEDELQTMDVEVAVASEPDINHLILTLYTRAHQDAELEREAAGRRRDQEFTSLDSADPSSPVAQRIALAIEEAAANDASDIHFQPERGGLILRERLHGNLIERSIIPAEMAQQTINRLKMLAHMSLESQLPQDARIALPIRVQGRETLLRMRVSCLPSQHGDSIVMRLLRDAAGLPSLEQTGFSGHNLKIIQQAIGGSNGMVLVTGPTGSGKTTLMHTLLKHLNDPRVKITTIEDPIEYEQARMVQTEIRRTDDPAQSLTFARVLRSQLRQDPDIIFVGEIRDEETADVSVQAAQTGHLLLSTLHTNSALGTVARMTDLGVAPYLLAESLRVVVAQRLVGRPCPECSVVEPVPDEYALTPGATMRRGTGDYRQIPVHEVLPITDDVRRAIAVRDPAGLSLAAQEAGLRTLRHDALEKVAAHQANLASVLDRVE
jgi:type IV pilus assembly protein PilB